MSRPPAVTPSHVMIRVADIDIAEAFYVGGLGFEVLARATPDPSFTAVLGVSPDETPVMIVIAKDGYRIELVQAGPRRRPNPTVTADFGLRHIALRVQDLDAVCATITAAGGAVADDSRIANASGRFVIAHDPDGVRLLIIEAAR